MKESLNNFEISAIVNEFQIMIDGYIEKVYQLSQDELLIYVRKNRERKKIYLKVGKCLCLTQKEIETPKTPTSFVMLLRKHLKGGRINEIKQHEFDRVIEFRIKENYGLIFELFRDGNVILLYENDIIQPLKIQSFRHRVLRAKHEYKHPPMKRNPFQIGKDDFIELIKNSKKEVVKTLAMDINLSSIYAEEVCIKAGMYKNTLSNSLESKDVLKLFNTLNGLLKKFCKELEPVVILEDEKIIDITPIKLKIYENFKFQPKDTFSEAVEYLFLKEVKRSDVKDAGKERLERQTKQQFEAIEKFKIEIEKGRKIGELIYSNYSLCDDILKKIKEKEDLGDRIIEYNPHEGYVILIITENNNEIKVKLDIKKNVSENAGLYFDRSKKAKSKLEGAKSALKRTENKIEKRIEIKRTFVKKKTFWFEKFRWFISSSGNLIIGGKDARSNERIVKKYLKDDDKYVHADIHGAPSVVVRNSEQITIDEQTMREASEFALGFSKAWNAKIGSGSVYWVDADQVSKTPISGEFLPKGSFIIRGKRNYLKLNVQVAVGEIEVEGVRKIVGGAVSAIKKRAERYIIIEPGDIKKNVFAKKLSKSFGVPLEEVIKALPPGDIRVVEQKGI